MKKTFSILLLLFAALTVAAQSNIYQYKYQIDSILQNDKNPARFQLQAFEYSKIGEYQLDLETFGHIWAGQKQPDLSTEKKAAFAKYQPVNAASYIIEQAKKTSIVIINEAHNHPEHRVFVTNLLPGLKRLGYNFIGCEALEYPDTDLNRRKYPILYQVNYPDEPCFGMMLRTALSLNYTAFPYEAKDDANGKEREIQEAENIAAVIKRNPKGKFVIYCGYDHAVEDSIKTWGLAMAGRLKHLTGVDPLTIDQVQLTETGTADYDNPYRNLINVAYPVVFINDDGKAFNTANPTKTFDMNVYHPQTKYTNGRPNWLKNADNRYVSVADKISIDFPCLVFAYNVNEDMDKAVPVDVIELDNKEEIKYLVLTKNPKVIKATNVKGQRQVFKIK